jgi:hypothetical protein
MLSRQMSFRLDCMMDGENPSRSGVLAERVLTALSRVPVSFSSVYFVKTLVGLPSSLTVIDDDEYLALKGLAHLAEDGIRGAVQELSKEPQRPIGARDLLAIRIALVLISKELRRGVEGELTALRSLWERQGHGLTLHLIDCLAALSADIGTYFSLSISPKSPRDYVVNLFSAANELMRPLKQLISIYQLPGRALRLLITTISELFSCADSAELKFAEGSDVSFTSQRTRQRCIELARFFVTLQDETASTSAMTTFRTLLRQASNPGNKDPVYHILQILWLIDHILPMPKQDAEAVDQVDLAANWVTPIIPQLLDDIVAFYRLLDPESRAHFLIRMADIDEGVVGIGEWLILDELTRLRDALSAISTANGNLIVASLKQHEAIGSLELIYIISSTSSSCGTRLVKYLASETEPAGVLTGALSTLLACRVFSPICVQVAENLLTAPPPSFEAGLRFVVALVLLRAVQHQDSTSKSLKLSTLLTNAKIALQDVPVKRIEPERLRNELRDALLTLALLRKSFSASEAEAMWSILDWLVQKSHAGLPQLSTLHGISQDTMASLLDRAGSVLPSSRVAGLETVRVSLTTPDEDASVLPSTQVSPEARFSIEDFDNALRGHATIPGTPKRTTPPHAQGMLGLVTISPPTALLRSPAVTGLTKTYNANDFRTLRQTPSARQNTSRLPSMHVDVSSRYHYL